MDNDDCCVFVSNDLDLFAEDMSTVNIIKKQVPTHDFQNPNINLNKVNVDLSQYLIPIPITDYFYGTIFMTIKLLCCFDNYKYKTPQAIPKLSRKQKLAFEYMKNIRPYFEKMKNKKHNFEIFANKTEVISTIPEYLTFVCEQNPNFYFKQISIYLNNFKLSLLYGYPIACCIKINDKYKAICIVGFDKFTFKIRTFDDHEQYLFMEQNELIDVCHNACVFFTKYFTSKDINLGFLLN